VIKDPPKIDGGGDPVEAYRRLFPDALARRTDSGWRPAPLPQVLLIGLGIPEIKSITHEALAALKACKTLFVYDATMKFFNEICPDVRPIGQVSDARENATLESFTSRVIEAGRANGPVGFAVYGHPMLYESLSHFLVEACEKTKTTYGVITGVSTVDRVLAAARISLFGDVGLQVSNSNHFLAGEPNLQSYLLLFKACEDLEILADVVEHALKFFPADHKVAVVACEAWDPEKVSWMRLDQVTKNVKRGEVFLTLVLPPCRRP
jgi:precorrin-2 methylase